MKRLLLTVALLVGLTIPATGQTSRNVTFVHGLNGSRSTWGYAENDLENEYAINSRRIGYSSDQSIGSIVSSKHGSVLNNSVVVAHSMGGVVAREMVRRYGAGRVSALITTGTPHKGALIADAIYNGDVQHMLNQTISELAWGWIRLGFRNEDVAAIVNALLRDLAFPELIEYVAESYQTRSAEDLRVQSTFINRLNQTPRNTFPSARYTIYGVEDFFRSWRLGITAKRGNYTEGPAGRIALGVAQLYGSVALLYREKADRAWERYVAYGRTRDSDDYLYYSGVSNAFFLGWVTIVDLHPLRWDLVTGAVEITPQGRKYVGSDALVSVPSQAPHFVPESRHLRALGANHLELVRKDNALERIREAFDSDDVNVPQVAPPPEPLSVSISGTSSLCPGGHGSWTASVSHGEMPYSYAWYYRKDNGTWYVQNESDNSFSRSMPTVNNSMSIKVTVTDGANTQTSATKLVYKEGGCDGSGGGGGLLSIEPLIHSADTASTGSGRE
jgi:pimeloyl-ACP methyl ester carboxylesterase